MPKYDYYKPDYPVECSRCRAPIPAGTIIFAEVDELGEIQLHYCDKCAKIIK